MLVIHQTNLDGHRAEYIEHILDWANKKGLETAIWVEFANLEELKSRFPQTALSQKRMTGIFSREACSELNLTSGTAKIVFLDGDNVLSFARRNFWWLSRYETHFLLLRANRPLSAFQLRAWAKFLAKLSIATLFNCHPRFAVKKLVFLRRKKVELIPGVRDPLYSRSAPVVKSHKNKSTDLVTVGIIGTIDPRKSIELAISSVENMGNGFQLQLVGNVAKSFESKLKILTEGKRFVNLKPGFLSDEDLDAEIMKLDCFLVLQQTNAPSGTLLKALRFGVPIVLGGAKVLAPAAKIYPENVTWTKFNSEQVAIRLRQALLKNPEPIPDLPGSIDFATDLLGN